MALKKTFTKTEKNFSGELSVVDAYWKVESIYADKFKGKAKLIAYTAPPSENSEIIYSMLIDFLIDLHGENFIKQAYKHIKTLPNFFDAVDC